MNTEGFGGHCFKDGICRTPDGRQMESCPTRRGDLERYAGQSPLLLAEDLCLRGLEGTGQSRMRDPFKDKCREVEDLLEQALALPGTHVMPAKEAALRHAAQTMGEAMLEKDIFSKSRLTYYLRLGRNALFLPALRSRIMGEPLDEDTMSRVHDGLCSSLVDFDERYLYSIPKQNHTERKLVTSERTEREVFGLLSRLRNSDYFPWPAFHREESSQIRSEHNHDGYCIDGEKIPFQIKENKSGNGYRGVVVIRHHDILRAMRRERMETTKRWEPKPGHEDYEWPSYYSYAEVEQGRKPDPIGHLLVEEMQAGKHLDRDKLTALNLASAYVVSRLDEFKRQQRSNHRIAN